MAELLSLDAMHLKSTILLLAGLVAAHSLGSILDSESEVIGCWKIDPSTFKVNSHMIPNTFPPPQLPTNLIAFELWLQKDGSFTASNVPPGFFFGWPATNEYGGTWQLHTNWSYKTLVPNTTYGDSKLTLQFNKPSQRVWESSVTKLGSKNPSYFLGLVQDGRDKTGTYYWYVHLRKQSPGDGR